MTRPMIAGFDLESTGLNTEKDRIVEIALIAYDATTFEPVGKFVRRVNPLCPIHPDAYATHGISLESLHDAPTFKDIAPQVAGLFGKFVMCVTHNGMGFDIPMLQTELHRVGLSLPPTMLVVDTMNDTRWATENGKAPKLGELCFALGIDYDPNLAHAAEYDVDRMMQAFFAGMRRGYFPDARLSLEDLCKRAA